MLVADEPLRGNLTGAEPQSGWKLVVLIQALFLAVALFQIDGPFLSAHNERQNQTYDVARNVFHHGWRGLLAPQASFSVPGYERQPFTSLQLELPFHGLLGWPISKLTTHERAIVRIISVLFALISIQLVYLILRHWFKPGFAVIGAAIWAGCPLVLQFGRAPMPDILCTAGMLAAFRLSLRGDLPGSSACFLFSILAKTSVIVFGLPILVALLIKRNRRSLGSILLDSLLWGLTPLCGLVAWILLVHWFSPPTPLSLQYWVTHGSAIAALSDINFWIQVVACVGPFGVGMLGLLGLAVGWKLLDRIHPLLKWAIVTSNAAYLVLVLCKVHEPQYFLPVVAWTVIGSVAGLEFLAGKLHPGFIWRGALTVGMATHLVVAAALAIDLRSSRVPDFASIEHIASILPAEARVIVGYPFYGASPAVWLNRNVFAVIDMASLESELPILRSAGFTHLCLLDIENRHNLRSGGLPMLKKQLHRMFGRPAAPTFEESAYAGANSAMRRYCDQRFALLFESPHAVLYSLVGVRTTSPGEHPPVKKSDVR